MQLIDTHSHIYLEEFDNDRDEIISRALDAGVNKILLPNIDGTSVNKMLNLVNKYPGICYPMMGVHPTSVRDNTSELIKTLDNWLPENNFVAIGEIGIDLYWDKSYLKQQEEIFRYQLNLAIEYNMPVVIHARDSFNEIFNILKDYQGNSLKGVFHAFTGDTGQAEHIINSGFLLGIGGIVTFRNSGLDKVVADIGTESIVLETDSPYLAPSPYRGKRNESSYIPVIARKVADITGVSIEKVAETSTKNALGLFGLATN